MSKPASKSATTPSPAIWAQALFAGSLMLATLSVWLLVTF